MARRKSLTIIVASLLLVIPFFCEAVNKRDTETEDSSSGEAEIPRPHHRVGYGGGNPNVGEEEEQEEQEEQEEHRRVGYAGGNPNVGEEEEEQVVQDGQGQDPTTGQEDAVDQNTPSPVAAVGRETSHLPRESDEEDVIKEDGVEEESVESTTFPAAAPSAAPLAPIPAEEQDPSQAQQPTHEESLSPNPSQSVIIWDGTGEPEREHIAAGKEPASQPEQPASQQDQSTNQPKQEEHASKPDQSAGVPEQPGNQQNQPFSQELHGGSNGNGQSQEPPSDKSSSPLDERKHEPDADARPVSVTASGSTSSPMAWVVVFAVVCSALLISGMGDSEADKESSCHLGCRHNFAEFNPYAWPPTPVNHNGITLRPIT